DRAAPAAMTAIVGNEAVAQRLVRRRLELAVHAGADREAGLVEPFLAVTGEEFAAHLLGEVGAIDDFRLFALPRRDRLGPRRVDFFFRRGAVLRHAVEHPVAAGLRLLWIARRVVIVGRLRQSGEERRFAEGQLVERFVEINQRRRLDAVGAGAEINLV